MASGSVKQRDHGYKKLRKKLREPMPSVTVGIHAADGDKAHSAGATILDVAIWNEFGTTRIPARSFLRAWFDEGKARLQDLFTRHAKKGTLDQFGAVCVGEIQARIAQGIPPPNAASTVRRKRSSKPLIDTGLLRSAITWLVSR